MRWVKFVGQDLKTSDILWTNSGLAFVDSGYTTGEPSRISSMPEAWSFSFENSDIHKRKREDRSAFITNAGWVYREKGYDGKRAFRIFFMYRPKKSNQTLTNHPTNTIAHG